VPFDFEQYLQLAKVMRMRKGRVMVSINDHPDIREVFKGFWMEGLDIKYSTGNAQGTPQTQGAGDHELGAGGNGRAVLTVNGKTRRWCRVYAKTSANYVVEQGGCL